MKSMRPPLATIFFMTNFYRAGGAWPPRPPPPDPLLKTERENCIIQYFKGLFTRSERKSESDIPDK